MTQTVGHRSLRDAFGQFATGVTVVSARGENDQAIGLTANSFASVSLEPPLVSWCVDKGSTRFRELIAAEYYTISVLAENQRSISDLFAYRSWDDGAFEEISWFEGPNGVPQIPDVGARFHCRQTQRYEAGDHVIIIGAVQSYESEPHPALVFFQGNYKILGED